MKQDILIVGNWYWDIYEEALASGFRAHNWKVIKHSYGELFSANFMNIVQRRLRFGPLIRKINYDLIDAFCESMPSVTFFYRSDLIWAKTIKLLKQIHPKSIIVTYHNDNPYIGLSNRFKMRHYLRSIALADITLVYRPSDVNNVKKFKARNIHILLPHYQSSMINNYNYVQPECQYDVVFIGHYEDDGREEYITYLVENSINVMIFGLNWEKCKNSHISAMKIVPVYGKDYVRILQASKIGLVFLSKKNRDVYTRRCFEIPASGTLMIAPKTKELELFFRNGKEAVYFQNKEELLKQVAYYLENESERKVIATAGKKRCIEDGQDEISRAQQVINLIRKQA